ncbi:MAG: hypothetical protein HDS65_11070 [Bacteroidales bacterium]|nr:hypothetical protein [Bacteroidales bacterium]
MKAFKILAAALIATSAFRADACTSMIVSAKASADGRPILWKHRDTSAKDNFLYRVEKPGKIGYVGLFNGSDSLRTDEAWMGMNDAGFAIMNTVAYNLPANSPDYIDREGFVMAQALEECKTVDDFEALLERLPKPLGVMTNFGVMDASGNGAYFETDDYTFERYNLSDADNGVLIRTNYAYGGTPDEGMGYIRHQNVQDLLAHQIETGSITPASLTETLSRTFYNSVTCFDAAQSSEKWAIDQDFIPRHSSTSSIAIEGLKPGEDASAMVMWANIAYPPCSHVVAVTLDSIPADALPIAADYAHARLSLDAMERMKQVFPITRGNGEKYIDLDAVRAISDEQSGISLEEYARKAASR